MKVLIKKLHEKAVTPKYAKPGDAGLDLVAIDRKVEKSEHGNYYLVTYNTGLSFEIPQGYVGLIFPRSSIFKKNMSLTNCVGVIDSGYRGEVTFKFRTKLSDIASPESMYSIGDRVGQMVIIPYPEVELVETSELTDTERGFGGFGSSGR